MSGVASSIDILLPALMAGLTVLSTHVPLGQRVLARGIIFIDLAVAQLAGLGAIVVHSLGVTAPAWVQCSAFGSALVGSGLLYLTERRWPHVQEAVIGTVFVLAASGVLLLLAHEPGEAQHLTTLLSGQILWVGVGQLGLPALISAVVLAAWFGFGGRRSAGAFYGLFAVSVTVSVSLVGVYLVFASLIVPALAARLLGRPDSLWLGYGVGFAGYVMGLAVSLGFDLPTGPAIVWALAAVSVMAVTLGATCRGLSAAR